MELIRSLRCSSLTRSVFICSFKTLIWPSSLPLLTTVSFCFTLISSISLLTDSISCSIFSYSSLISSCSFVLLSSSAQAISYFSVTCFNCSLICSVSKRNILTSYFFNSSLYLRYCLAFSDCFSSGPTCFSSSPRISFTRVRLACSSSNFLTAAAFLLLNLTIPAASSNSSLLSSGLPLKIRSI